VGAPLLQHAIANGVHYVHHPHHRNHMDQKSQWTISENDERGVFADAHHRNWLISYKGWGLKILNCQIVYLGVAQDHVEEVFVAKFVCGGPGQPWHGYPADHRNNSADIPDREILDDWIKNKVLPACKVSKILGGKKCRL
jgi:hypothetical protein